MLNSTLHIQLSSYVFTIKFLAWENFLKGENPFKGEHFLFSKKLFSFSIDSTKFS